MKILYPREYEKANKPSWVVRYLRGIAIIEFIGAFLATFTLSNSSVQIFLRQQFHLAIDTASIVALIVCVVLGIFAGLAACVLTWGLAMAVDDLHAMRQYLEGYNIHEE